MEHSRQKLPVDIQSFEVMRAENYLYVDKTRHVYRMATEGRFYFLSRPRRFGKSLLVSTLKCLFQARQDLFAGLWIAAESDWDWQPYPVITIDFNGIPGATPAELRHALAYYLCEQAAAMQIKLKSDLPEILLRKLILRLSKQTGKPVVVLIDEYDKRIIEHLGKGPERLDMAKANREALKSFFGVLKDYDVSANLRFVFLTGVSRFSKVSLFSELNNLFDLSMDSEYADMLGYTQAELDENFQEAMAQLAAALDWTPAQVKAALAQYYNGYRFSERAVRVYNPFSILNAFRHQQVKAFWFESGTPTFLVEVLKEQHYDLPTIEGLQVSPAIFSNFELEHLRPEALLFQTGYLTITDVQDGIYTLDYPNQEVKQALAEALLLATSETKNMAVSALVLKLPGYLQRENFAAFFEAIRAIFASIPYDIQTQRDEAYYHTIFYLLMSAAGISAQSSLLTCDGRIDLVVTVADKIYLIEFKCNHSAAAALRQIQAQRYADRFRGRGKTIFAMGINFNTNTRNLEEWQIQPEPA